MHFIISAVVLPLSNYFHFSYPSTSVHLHYLVFTLHSNTAVVKILPILFMVYYHCLPTTVYTAKKRLWTEPVLYLPLPQSQTRHQFPRTQRTDFQNKKFVFNTFLKLFLTYNLQLFIHPPHSQVPVRSFIRTKK